MYLAILCDDSLRYRSKEQKRHEKKEKEKSVLTFLFARILAEGAIALSVTLSGGALFAS